jgi:gliding motility-associated-like protein
MYKFVWELSNTACEPTVDTISVFVRAAVTTAHAGNDVVVCDFVTARSIALNANTDTKGAFETRQWTLLSQPTNGNGVIIDPSNPVSEFSFKAAGSYQLIWTITNDAACPPTKDTVTINVVEKPVAGPVTATTDYCGASDVVVTTAGFTGAIKKWQYNPSPINDNIWRDTLVTTPTITFASAQDTFAVRVIIESVNAKNVCTSTDTSNALIINITPSALPGSTGPDAIVCNNSNSGTITLTGNLGKVIRWEYSESAGWIIINNTTTSVTYNNLTATRSYRAIVKNGDCPEVTSTTTVITVLNEVTKANAGADQLICNSSAILQGNEPAASEKGEWKQISGPNTATLSGITTPSVNAYDLIAGSYQFSWTISNGACPSSADTVNINVRPAITSAVAGSDTVICDFVTSGFIKLNASNGNPDRKYETKSWKIISQPTTAIATLGNVTDPNAIFNFNAAGTYALEWSITNDAGCLPTKDTVTITVVQKPAAGKITATPVVCAGSDVAVNMGAYTGVIRKWQYNPAPINDNIWIDTAVTSSDINFLNVRDTFGVRAIVDANAAGLGCYSSDTSNAIVVNVIPGTIPGTTGPDATICKGSNSGNIELKGYVGNIIKWEYSANNGSNWNTINNTTSAFNYNNLNTTTLFRAVVESGTCGSAFSSITKITVIDIVTTAAAGTDQTLCAATSINLNGNVAATGETVSWKQVKGSTVIFSSITVPNPTISDLQPGTYSFVYTITNSVCPATDDTVNITIHPAIGNTIDNVGKTICSGQTVTISGQNATGGNGKYQYQWQSSNDGTTWADLNGEYNVNLTIIPTRNIYLRRLINSLPCTSVSDPVFIIVQAPITNNTINSDQKICINTPAALLNGSLPTGATGSYAYEWQQSIDTGKTWVTIFNAAAQNYDPGTLKVTTSFRRILTSGYCVGDQSNSSNVVTVVVNLDTKAEFTYTKDTNCPPFVIDNTVITTSGSSAANGTYNWYANNKLIGTGITFPGYTLAHGNDSVNIKLVTVSSFGCKDDTTQHKFFTMRTVSQPAFTVSNSEGCGPLTVAFTNRTPDISHFTYKWNFGNGITSTSANPGNIIFRSNPEYGDTVYKVSLTVYSACDSITVYENIKVRSAAQALFKPDRTVGCSPMTVTFTNYSAGANDFTWNFDDGTIVNTTQTGSLQHTFTSAVQDTFRVSLIARSECGSDTQYYSIVISPNNIRLILTVNGDQRAGCSPHTVQLINNSKGATSFRWDLGDGNTLTTTRNIDTITHRYVLPGNYTIKLFASNSCSESSTSDSIIVYRKPAVDFSLQPSTVCLGDTIHFTNLSDTITGSTWSFGDGAFSNLTSPEHTYTTAGVYTVSLTGIRQYPAGSGCIDSVHKTVTVIESLPGSFTMSDSVGRCTPFTVTFRNKNLPSKSTVWDFGDGRKDTGDVVKHTFLNNGTFNIKMTSLDPGGCKYTDAKRVVVDGPAGSFTYESAVKCDKTPVRFKTSLVRVDSVRWDFGDGTISKSTTDLVYHTYAKPGNYLPSLKLFGGASCQQLLAGPDTIRVDLIKAGFRQSMTAACENTTVSFRDTSAAYTGVASCVWKFGDGALDSVPHPTHVYKAANSWLVQLISTSKYGCADTATQPVAVSVNARPVAAIISDSTACANSKIVFTSSVVSADTVLSYRWSFSNGVNTNGTAANNMYANAGTYKATLIVSTINGCLDTTSRAITINPAPAISSTNDQILCRGQSVQLNASGANKFTWGPASNLSCINCSSPIATPVATTRYTVKGVNSFGCESIDTVTINITQPFKIKASPNDSLCIGDKTELFAAGADKYKWSPATGLSNSEISNPVAVPSLTTQYRVVGTDSNRCFTDTAYLTISVGKYPTVNLGPDKVLSAGTAFPLTPATTNGPISKWSWNPSADLSCNNCATPVANIKKDITYAVTTTNAYGCTASDTINIKVFCESAQVFIPNIFTPDGDGVNDILMVRGTGINSVKSFRIFNRWGEIVFEKSNFRVNEKSNGWDGTVRGAKAPTDVYVYTCEVVCENGNSFVYKGNVAIIK